MSLGNGRTYLAIPGPSVMPERVIRAMMRAAPNIYHGELPAMMPGIVADLKAVARTRHNVAIYIANGHGAWEASLSNTMSRGETVLVCVTGRFAHGWAEVAQGMGINCEFLTFGENAPIEPEIVRERLVSDTAGRIRAILVVQTDTATSVLSDVAALRAAIDASGHDALLMVDCIASLACDRMEMDEWGVDVLITGSQKGLMTPPGLGFVFFNDKAERWRDTANAVTHYWDWRPRSAPGYFSQYFDGTAPTHLVYALREALDIIGEEGLDAIWTRHEALASAVWAAFEAWGSAGSIRLNVSDPAHRSRAVTGVGAGSDKAEALRAWCEEKAGLTLGIGLGKEPSDHYFRLGHMGHVNASMIMGALATIEAGLTAVGIPHGAGGTEAAAKVIAARA